MIRVSLLILSLSLSFVAVAAEPPSRWRCAQFLKENESPMSFEDYRQMGFIIVDCTHGNCKGPGQYFFMGHEDYRDLLVSFHLFPNGLLRSDIVVRDDKGRAFHPKIRGSNLFALAMKIWGDRIQAIAGEWQGKESDNLAMFNQAIQEQGTTIASAALKTWTGQQATRFGFTEAVLVDKKGKAAPYKRVDFFFLKPEESKSIRELKTDYYKD